MAPHFTITLCVPDVVKNINIKDFSQISWTNEKVYVSWYEACKCKCRLGASVFNNKQCWNNDKCRCECKELIDTDRCDKEFIWSPSKCECECDKSCDFGQHLNYESCKCRNKLIDDKLVEKCSENIDGNKMIYNATLNNYGNVCNVCTIYIALFVIAFLIIIGIISAYFYFYWYLKKDNAIINIGANTGALTYKWKILKK